MRFPCIATAMRQLFLICAAALALACGDRDVPVVDLELKETATTGGSFGGTESCRDCHERFYRLWAPSWHGLAMRPFTPELARKRLSPQSAPLGLQGATYQAVFDDAGGGIVERGAEGEKIYPIAHALGGKNVYYFLTELERGRLQVLPVAYDVSAGEWFDTAASAMRHFPEGDDESLPWRHPAYTFNTSCHSCHVSQLSTNYDLRSDTYQTTWAEPGINCETCHGPGEEHVRAFRAAAEDRPPEDLKIIVTSGFTKQQTNDLCASCHAKARTLSTDFQPGDRFYDHFDLVTLEDQDYYPDGRDLGENYTHTTWLLSPCVRAGDLDCLHCHTSSGRFRQADDPNQLCLPCHEGKVTHADVHSRHESGTEGSYCISCHMPSTRFARMERHDHSMRPPSPASTLAFESPNACNGCHGDKDASWAEQRIREWHGPEYEEPGTSPAELIRDARKRDWTRLAEMLAFVMDPSGDEVYAASMIRLLRRCEDGAATDAIRAAMDHPSPLVRGSAAEVLGDRIGPESEEALVTATRDDYRLVRIRASAALARFDTRALPANDRAAVEAATAEWVDSMRTRPDDSHSHYNLGNFYLNSTETRRAIEEYRIAVRLRPDLVPPLVNLASALAMVGERTEAEDALRRAVTLEPDSAAARFNLGLLLGEQGRLAEAAEAHRAALKADPNLAPAAYNLGVILAGDDVNEGLPWCRRAAELRPEDVKYGYTLAFYLQQSGDTEGSVARLERLIAAHPGHADAWMLLGSLYEQLERVDDARALYRAGAGNERLPPDLRRRFAARLSAHGTS